MKNEASLLQRWVEARKQMRCGACAIFYNGCASKRVAISLSRG